MAKIGKNNFLDLWSKNLNDSYDITSYCFCNYQIAKQHKYYLTPYKD